MQVEYKDVFILFDLFCKRSLCDPKLFAFWVSARFQLEYFIDCNQLLASVLYGRTKSDLLRYNYSTKPELLSLISEIQRLDPRLPYFDADSIDRLSGDILSMPSYVSAPVEDRISIVLAWFLVSLDGCLKISPDALDKLQKAH